MRWTKIYRVNVSMQLTPEGNNSLKERERGIAYTQNGTLVTNCTFSHLHNAHLWDICSSLIKSFFSTK